MIRATAPGKLILAGEHAAVYGRPALVAAVSACTRVTVGPATGGGVRLKLMDVGVEATSHWDAIGEYGRVARRAWEAYRHQPSSERLTALSAGDPAHVVKVALAETVKALAVTPRGAVVRVESELPVGAGFGSSASVAVATVGAVSMFLTDRAEPAVVDRVAFEVERRQHGRPSGADHATVLYGGLQWFERIAGDELSRRTLAFDSDLLARLRVFQSGIPIESTGQLVETVRQRFAERPDHLTEILDRMESDTRALRGALVGGDKGSDMRSLLQSCEQGLELLGVVPATVRNSIRRVEVAGGAAKISGAGALSGVGAGALLAYSEGGDGRLEGLSAYQRLDVDLGAPGLSLDLD